MKRTISETETFFIDDRQKKKKCFLAPDMYRNQQRMCLDIMSCELCCLFVNTGSNTRGAKNEGPEAEYEVREESTDLAIIAGETEHGTETELINKARQAPKPTDSDQKNKEDESESVTDVTEKLMEGQTEDNLQKEGGEQESEGGCRIS